MSWYVFALICTLGWGAADLFYKKGSETEDKDSHLKTAVWVGLVMGVAALALVPFAETVTFSKKLPEQMLKYLPASASYIISMVVGYAGLRYLELSIVSPLQNASGAFAMIAMLVFYGIRGNIGEVKEEFIAIDYIGTGLIIVGVVALAIVEKKLSAEEEKKEEKKYRIGFLALLFPLTYCIFDTIGTAADGIILDEESGMGLGEIDVLILYGLTFFFAGIIAYLVLWKKNRRPYRLFEKKEISTKGIAALCEEAGQFFYVYAMAKEPVLAAPLIASYCIVSVILSRLFLKEKLKMRQYSCIFTVIIGIVLLGIAEGLKG